MTDSEWEESQKTLQLEMEACSKALAILRGDSAHDLFTKTFNFVQAKSTGSPYRKSSACVNLDRVPGHDGDHRRM
eukprot:7014584-Heterocapsa_arctica.AAC.1